MRPWLLAQAEEQDSSLPSCLKQVEHWTKIQRLAYRGVEGREGVARAQRGSPCRWKVGRPRRPESEGMWSSTPSADPELHVREEKPPEPENRKTLLRRRRGTRGNPYRRGGAPLSQSTGLLRHKAPEDPSEGPPERPAHLFQPYRASRAGCERIQLRPPSEQHWRAAAGAQLPTESPEHPP